MMENNKTQLNVLGVMSGTSLDGLDLALVQLLNSMKICFLAQK